MKGFFKESDGDWFFIPAKMEKEWEPLRELLDDTDSEDYLDNCENFEDVFGEYRIDGSPDNYKVDKPND